MSFLGMIGVGIGAVNCYFGLKILNFVAKMYAAIIFAILGYLMGYMISDSIVGFTCLIGLVLGIIFGDKIKKAIISVATGLSAGAMLYFLTYMLNFGDFLSGLLGFVAFVGVTYITFILFDSIMIIITAINGACLGGMSFYLVIPLKFICFIVGVALLITGVLFQYKGRPQNELQEALSKIKNIKNSIKLPENMPKIPTNVVTSKVCTQCQKKVSKQDSFCPDCGGACEVPAPAATNINN